MRSSSTPTLVSILSDIWVAEGLVLTYRALRHLSREGNSLQHRQRGAVACEETICVPAALADEARREMLGM